MGLVFTKQMEFYARLVEITNIDNYITNFKALYQIYQVVQRTILICTLELVKFVVEKLGVARSTNLLAKIATQTATLSI